MNDVMLSWGELSAVEFSELEPQMQTVLGASSKNSKLLRFRGAVLARAEVNANNDELTEEGLRQVASTLPLSPIDIEHNARQVCGYYTAAHVAEGALLTDGVIFADRFPEIAEGMKASPPIYKQSIEATAESAQCSLCGNVFVSKNDYCNHLLSRRETGAVRKLKNLKGVGGAVTKIPAGSRTEFDAKQIYMIASLEADAPRAAKPSIKETLMAFVSEPKTLTGDASAAVAELTSRMHDMLSQIGYPVVRMQVQAQAPQSVTASLSLEAFESAQHEWQETVKALQGKVNELEEKLQEQSKVVASKARTGMVGISAAQGNTSKPAEASLRVLPK